MKKSKILFFILGALVFSLSACNASNENSGGSNDPTPGHEHTYSSSWNYDNTYHWHDATCGHDVVDSKATHTFNDVVTAPTYSAGGYTTHTCTVCGYSYTDNETSQLIHNYSQNWTSDSSTHWHACTDSGYEHLKQDEATHTFNDVVTAPTYSAGGYTTHTCTVCGYSYTDNETSQLTYTITWLNWDGSLLSEDYYYQGEYPSYTGTPTKEKDDNFSYSFSGWYPSIVPVDSNATYTAQFSSSTRQYSVHYNANGGVGAPEDQTKTKNEDLILSSKAPTREHYTFCGWNCFSSSNVYQPNGIFDIDEDITLYAMWCEHCHTCDGHGTVEYKETCSKCSGKGTITTSTQHWVNCSSCNGKGTITISYTGVCSSCNGWGGDVLCECSCGYKWWANQTNSRKCSRCGKTVTGTRYTTCSTCGGTGTQKKTQTSTCSSCNGSGGRYTTSTSTSTCSTCQGLGKLTKSKTCGSCNGEKYLYPQTPVLNNVTYKTVTLKTVNGFEYSNGGIVWQSSNVFENLSAKTTYTFYQRKAGDSDTPFGISSKGLQVTTSSIPTYSITYYLNGGSATNPASYTVESEDIVLNNPIRKGYSFLGWTGSNGDVPEMTVCIEHGSSGNKTYYANWEANVYTITFVTNGGDTMEPITAPCDSTIIVPDPVFSGKVFAGWYLDSQLTQGITLNKMPNEDTIVYAKWNTICNVTLDPKGGHVEGNTVISITENNQYSLPTPTREGYSFTGWFNGETKVANAGKWLYDYDIVLTAKWQLTNYTITYNLFGGTNHSSNPTNYTIESDSIELKNPSKAGCDFIGWTDGNGNPITTIPNGSSGDIVLNANWEAHLFDLQVLSSDESLGTVSILNGSGYCDESITVLATPKEHHGFSGWYVGETLVSRNKSYTFSMPASDYTLVARFSETSEEWLRNHGAIPSISNNVVTYGMYPQTKVSDNSLISLLNSDASEPNEVGYQLYNDEYYEKLGSDWFKVEPIKWNVLKNSDGTYMLASTLILDCEIYDDDSNNYEQSILRSFLNTTFYEKAFFLNEEYVQLTNVDNSATSTGKSSNSNACNNTNDKVFALSVKELNDLTTTSRLLQPTDYAKARGCWVDSDNEGCYWTRSPEASRANCAYRVLNGGSIATETNKYAMVYRTDDGVRPAITLKFDF